MYPANPSVRRCPRCHDTAYRVRRRLFDRLVSLFVPVHRFHCENPQCGWEGNLRAQDGRASR